MSFQGFFFKTCGLINSSHLLFANKLPQFFQSSGIRQKVVNQLKELKVPEEPKRPLTPYFRFLRDHRTSIVKQHPNWKITQISVQCASDWKEIDPDTKRKYEDEYKNELEDYAAKFSQYQKILTPEQKELIEKLKIEKKAAKARREQRKKVREFEKPKRPLGAYLLYVMDTAKTTGTPFNKLLGKLKGTWGELEAGAKAPYFQEAAKSKEQYEKILKEWELKMIQEGNLDLVRQSTLTGREPKPKSVSKSKN